MQQQQLPPTRPEIGRSLIDNTLEIIEKQDRTLRQFLDCVQSPPAALKSRVGQNWFRRLNLIPAGFVSSTLVVH